MMRIIFGFLDFTGGRKLFETWQRMTAEEYSRKCTEMINRFLELAPQLEYNLKPRSAPTRDTQISANQLANYAEQGYQGKESRDNFDSLCYYLEDEDLHGLHMELCDKSDDVQAFCDASRHLTYALLELLNEEELAFMHIVSMKSWYVRTDRIVRDASKFFDDIGVDIVDIKG